VTNGLVCVDKQYLIRRGKLPKAYVNGININYKVEGQGEPLVLIMGGVAPRQAWFFQTRAFKKYYKVITFDNRDAAFGKTDKPSSPYTIRAMADDTIGLMDHLGIDKAHILGYSMGGIIAQELAINYPERVRKLILAATFSGLEDVMAEVTSEVLKNVGLREGFSEEDARSVDIREALSSIIPLAFNSMLYRMILIYVAPETYLYARLGGFKGLMGQIEAIVGCNTLDRLHTIQAPTLVITGAEDKLVPARSSDVIASKIPNTKLVKVEGGSHGYVMEMRGSFNKEVLDFLRAN